MSAEAPIARDAAAVVPTFGAALWVPPTGTSVMRVTARSARVLGHLASTRKADVGCGQVAVESVVGVCPATTDSSFGSVRGPSARAL
jgi:hypothetical protein